MRAEHILVASVAVFAFIILATVVSNIAFYLRLKRYEPTTWQLLGAPMPFVNLDMYNFTTVRNFLIAREHRKLRDPMSAMLGSMMLFFDRLFLGFIVLAAIVVGYIVLFVDP
jgi:hypothetical protein